MKTFILVIILLFCSATSVAQTLSRLPYLQRVSDTAAIIRYRTDTATNTIINYGVSQGSLNLNFTDGTNTTEHRVELSGLNADTKYYYQVSSRSGNLTIDDGTYFFKTNPLPGMSKSTRLWILGDSGRGSSGAYAVKEGYKIFSANSRAADLFLMLGDNAYFFGLDNEFDTGLFNVYPEILKNTPLWPTLGNHDGNAKTKVSGEIPYYASFSLPRNAEVGGVASGTESYYSFNYANIHFICLNSYDEDRSSNGAMANWLKHDLLNDSSMWKIAFWHHPPYSKGSHDSDSAVELIEMREKILPILEDGGVDLALAGHSHSYERSFLINGHYGNSSTLNSSMVFEISTSSTYHKPPQNVTNRGTIYTVNGVGSFAGGGGTINHPAMQFNQSTLGSMIIDVEGKELLARFIGTNGQEIESFSISKNIRKANITGQKTYLGRSAGNINLLLRADRRTQKLFFSRKRKSIKSIYSFDFGKEFHTGNLVINARKSNRHVGNMLVSYSIDGRNFKRLTTIKNSTNTPTVKLPIPEVLDKKLFIRITSRSSAKKSNYSYLVIDELAVNNE